MPQKPVATNRNKRRLAKRLANWRAKQENVAAPKEAPKKAEAKS